jgi:outer membrane protein TolC
MAIHDFWRGVLVALSTTVFSSFAFAQAPATRSAASPAATQPEQLPTAPNATNTCDCGRVYQLSLEEARCRTLQNSVIMELASTNIEAKYHALEAARKDYLPKLLNSFSYFHFDSDLGIVLTTPGIINPAVSKAVPVVNQDASIYTAAAIQPITPLAKVNAVVEISTADVGAAKAEKQLARRELTKGVEQLYFGLLAVRKIQATLREAAAGAEQMVKATNSSDAKIALVEVQQDLVTVNGQEANLQEQLNQLVSLPPCTQLVLLDPPLPQNPFECADEAVQSALASSPKICEARMLVEKAEGAVRLANADYLPSVNAYGFYVNQTATPTIQDGFTGVGLSASYLLEWGKKNDTLRQYKATEVLARQNLQKEMQDVQLTTIKAFNETHRTQQAFDYAQQLATLNREAKLPADPFQLKFAIKDRLEAEVGVLKTDGDYRNAVIELRSLAGCCE